MDWSQVAGACVTIGSGVVLGTTSAVLVQALRSYDDIPAETWPVVYRVVFVGGTAVATYWVVKTYTSVLINDELLFVLVACAFALALAVHWLVKTPQETNETRPAIL